MFRVATDSDDDVSEFGWSVFWIASVCGFDEVCSCLPRSTVFEFGPGVEFLCNSSELFCCVFRGFEGWSEFGEVVES